MDSGTYVSTGATITVVSAAPAEGAGGFQVAATAPLYADGLLGNTLSAPTASGVTTAGPVTVGTLALAAGSSAASVTASVQPASTGKYDHGEIMLSRNGQLVASAPIDAALQDASQPRFRRGITREVIERRILEFLCVWRGAGLDECRHGGPL